MFTVEQNTVRMPFCAELFQRREKEGDVFQSRIITGDETWIHQYVPLKKGLSTEWRHQSSARKKKLNVQTCAGSHG
jgi:hypothetical protein